MRGRLASSCLLLAGAAALAASCSKGSGGAAAPAPGAAPAAGAPSAGMQVNGTPHPDALVSALKSAGLQPEGFAPLTPVPYGAAYCEEGRVETIDTLVCEYRDQPSLDKGKSALLDQWGREGGHTGLALGSKLTLLGVFDRARHDPNGKVISRVIDTFRKL
jgi:hypothetical protein